ncbi:MAG TPA: hypothetical protein PLW31_04960 [Bacteroidales bacterium]|nr:hypothetical protein [Bacteroidales bacterium]HOX77371.1 hypothetical protein [Bacteroidales bacterium]HPI85694.1 hypothetical protein [Bacteroidales bacterium]HPM91549.1 hypothetical protein [Bacteroidales bacterium]
MSFYKSIGSISFRNFIRITPVLLLILNALSVTSQGYTKDVRSYQSDDKVIIQYRLKVTNKKGYVDYNHRMKSRRFDISLFHSYDQGNQYHSSGNVKGKVGKNIHAGQGKRIIWRPDSEFGYIGNIQFKVEANPRIPKVCWGLSYSRGIYNFGTLRSPEINRIHLKIYKIGKGNGSTFFPLGISTGNTRVIQDSYIPDSSYILIEIKKTLSKALTVGIGGQTRNRAFSIYVAAGVMIQDEDIEKFKEESDNILVDAGKEFTSDLKFILDGGISIKLFDTKPFTVLLPVNVFWEPIDQDYISINTGLEVQF